MHCIKMYVWYIHTSSVLPGVICPGHHAIAGTLIPPSKVLPLPHLNGPAFPPLGPFNNHGLEINIIKIFCEQYNAPYFMHL